MAYNDPYGFAKAAAPSSKGSGGYVDPYGLNGAGASAPASGGGGGIGGFLGKLGGGLVSAAEHTPAGVVAIGKAVGQDVLGQIEHPITPTHTSHTLPLLEAMGKQTKTDVSHPLRNPANTLLDVLGVASAGAGTVGRIAAAGKALSTAEDVGAAARLGGAAKALVTKPAPVTRLISHDGVSVELPAASNPLTRTFQKGVDKLRETFPNVPAVGAASVVGKETARGIRYEGQVARAPVDTLNKLAGDAGMLKHTPTGKLTADALARQHALRVAAEGVPTPSASPITKASSPRASSRRRKTRLSAICARAPSRAAMRNRSSSTARRRSTSMSRARSRALSKSWRRRISRCSRLRATVRRLSRVSAS